MKNSLLNSNPWLREPGRRAALLRVSAASSSAVEGIIQPFSKKAAATVKPVAKKRVKFAPAHG